MRPSTVDLSRLTPLDSLYEEVRLARSYRMAGAVHRAWMRFKVHWEPAEGWAQSREEGPYRWPLIIRTALVEEDPEMVCLVYPKAKIYLPTLEAVLSWED